MNPWLIVGFVVALGVATITGYIKGDSAGRAVVQQQWDQERAQQAAEHAKAQAAAREKEQQLQAQADQLREEKDREILDLATRNTTLTNSLRNRPSRPAPAPSGVSQTTVTELPATSCTGSGLSREDAEFLAGEATRADQLRIALKQCVAQYQAVAGK